MVQERKSADGRKLQSFQDFTVFAAYHRVVSKQTHPVPKWENLLQILENLRSTFLLISDRAYLFLSRVPSSPVNEHHQHKPESDLSYSIVIPAGGLRPFIANS
jgi:hypothetical protein